MDLHRIAPLMFIALAGCGVAIAQKPDQGAGAHARAEGEGPSGTLHVPQGYRARYEFLGAFAVAADEGPGSKEQHITFVSPGGTAAFRRLGRFPDGTTLVKEVYATETEALTTGTVSHAKMLKGWFVMVKDGANRHSGNPLWGDGWGWAWFDAASPMKSATKDYQAECKACHVPAQATDWLYTRGYPVLQTK